MAAAVSSAVRIAATLLCFQINPVLPSQILNPPYFNLAEGRNISATATCGDQGTPELYCKLVGANLDKQDNPNINIIQGQVCDYCDDPRRDYPPHVFEGDPLDQRREHPARYAIDGTERWWQSPPLSRGTRFNEVNLTVDLGQEFHVAYVFIKMANSPRPGVWVLERSTDNGKTYKAWQYFADSIDDCRTIFGPDVEDSIKRDDSVICETKFSKVVPLEGGEMVISLLNGRPSADNFTYSPVLQEWTKATNIRMRLLRTKTLLGHLMSVERQDPTVTRRYFYSIKDLNIGGRCVCNGHADTCDITDPANTYKLNCRCQHHTCGHQCEQCCPGYMQNKWQRASIDNPNVCEPCNCFGHSNDCYYDEKVDEQQLSLNIHGIYDGGGVCQNCQHNTEGINCNKCKPGFYRPYNKPLNATDVCQPCQCDPTYSSGNCSEGSGQCECRPEFLPPNCDQCNVGYYGYPTCRPCDCHAEGTQGRVCQVNGGQCPCRPYYEGKNCDRCAPGYYGFPHCQPCDCHPTASLGRTCDDTTGQCQCRNSYGGRQCLECQVGFYDYPSCKLCACDTTGTLDDVCSNQTGQCLCKPEYGGARCDQCALGYYGFPNCIPCKCDPKGSLSEVCDASGRCPCLASFTGLQCDQCAPGYFSYPECHPCECDTYGAVGISCGNDGTCFCKSNFDGEKCNSCKKGFYNYPLCEGCNCNPAGILPTFGGCGSLTSGELCECKERVTGRICDQCRPLFWSLKPANPQGCEECECHIPGTVGGLGVCDGQSGQCLCKPNVGQRQCTTCLDGTFMLQEDNLLGCQDCGCDVGGSVGSKCDQRNGQCPCRPRITGRRCSEPLQAHYFPTLHQHKYEVEDGHTPSGVNARFDFDEALFPGFSWRGYAIFSNIQKEILLDLHIQKPGLYQVIARYVSLNGDNMYSNITFTPDFYGETKQSEILILPPSKEPRFQAVVGPDGVTALPFVLNPGRWTLSIKVQKPVFMDYIVLLPEAFYEATLLQEKVKQPCLRGQATEVACLQLRYPALPDGAVPVSAAQAGYVEDNGQQNPIKLLDDQDTLDELRSGPMAHLTEEHTMTLELKAPSPGRYVFLLFYHSLDSNDSLPADVSLSNSDALATGKVNLHRCKYNMVCRQVVVDHLNRVLEFGLKDDPVRITIDLGEDSNTELAVERIVAVPALQWHTDYLLPGRECVLREGECQGLPFPAFSPAAKVEFESAEDAMVATDLPTTLKDNGTSLVLLDHRNPMVTLNDTVPEPGLYVLVAHYFQPDHPAFELMTVLESGGHQRDTKLPLEHCPWTSGCRAVLLNPQTGTTAFPLVDNFTLTFEVPDQKSVWLDHLMLIREDQFDKSMLQPLPLDKAVEFIKQCGQNSLYVNTDTSDFCKEAVFSVTAEYNNGALPCQCNIDGSLSFECERFGGQCQCKENVIGRTCSQCRTGYYGFPACQPCDCPNTAVCHPVTGQCICPPRVTGEKCDTCVPLTFGYTRIVGCEECNCNPHGVQGGNLQCDLQSGQCRCKNSIVGRTCDECKWGYWDFPRCRLCNCDLRGTVEEICNQDTAECFCKENVEGESCDTCKPGTFFLEESNPVGCTKCFCFGTTDRCNSALLYRSQIVEMDGWTSTGLNVLGELTRGDLEAPVSSSPRSVEVTPPAELPVGSLLYFAAPSPYLGNKVTSYGGMLSFSLSTKVDYAVDFGSVIGPDIILTGNNVTLVHEHLEQPAAGVPLDFSIKLVEGEFRQLGGRKATREQLMVTLVNLDGLYIRASYFQPSLQVKLSNVALDTALSTYLADAAQSLTVEQCHCPPSYKGTSCEECAPGYYRSRTGPYLGFCVPCQCNNHGDTCDVVTGKCYNCRDNTYGDHCEKCLPGYHGDATRGNPDDCLICACPIPLPSNNFAESCEVSPSGQEISCNCKKGYYGARCDVCDAGYFGQPDVIGSSCEPCHCSGNIDPENPASCDSVTGECVLCLNNTFGTACELCAPGFYGDAIMGKNCRKCSCDKCGMYSCDPAAGTCSCHDNVIGELCDQCAPNHWGFSSCQGCRPCDCGLASQSKQCDLETGQCPCQPGAGGLRCEACEPGFWRYSISGCISCNCAAKFSAGAVCNQQTGQCQCLPGVIGEKCDSCPHRWVFVERQGCHECGECVHALLDDTDQLAGLFGGIQFEVKDLSATYLANQRLQVVNQTAHDLQLQFETFQSEREAEDASPLGQNVSDLEIFGNVVRKSMSVILSSARTNDNAAFATKMAALQEEADVNKTIKEMQDILYNLMTFSEGISTSSASSIEPMLQEAKHITERLNDTTFVPEFRQSEDDLAEAREALEQAQQFSLPAVQNNATLAELRRSMQQDLEDRLHELANHTARANTMMRKASGLLHKANSSPFRGLVTQSEELQSKAQELLREGDELLRQCSGFNLDADKALDALGDNERRLRDSVDELKETLAKVKKQTDDVEPAVYDAVDHSQQLENQAEECKNILYDTKQTSTSALAYDEIAKAVDDALNYSHAAKAAADEAHSMSVGIIDRASDSKGNSEGLLANARELEQHVEHEMKPRVGDAVEKLATIELHNKMNAKDLQDLARDMDNLETAEGQEALQTSVTAVQAAADQVQETADKIDSILQRLPGENTHAQELSSDNVGYQQALLAAGNYIDRVMAPEPDLGRLANRLLQRHKAMKDHATDIQNKLEELRRKVALAKDEANRVKIGMEFKGEQWLRLKNPEDLQEAATYTHLSLHAKTDKPDGTLFYLGNGKNPQPRAKRSREGDFMALVLRDGYPVLLVNLGDGIEEIRNDKYVADNRWHHIIIDRTGKTVNLEVRTEGESDSTKTKYLQGTSSVFNLDQSMSEFYIGGVPDTEDVQLSPRDTMPFVGFLEELQFGGLPVGLWNFHSHGGKLEGCQERDSLIDIPSGRGLRFDGTGYAIVSKEGRHFNDGISISMKFRTYAREGLLFLIHSEGPFMALELRDGHVVYKFDLGSGMMQMRSNAAYNDGQWHQLRAAQLLGEADLTVGGNDSKTDVYRGEEKGIDSNDDIFIGGHPTFHGHMEVTRMNFEGCIEELELDARLVNLHKTKEALAVTTGCPPNVARVVSFSAESPGFVAMPFMDLTENAQLTLKFRTNRPNGLIFYTSNEDHSKFLALGLRGGRLFLQARPGGRVETEGTYDDGRWHYVTASSYSNRLRLDIDDALVVQENAVEPILIHTTSPLYFGGLPTGVQANPELQLDGRTFFVGCLGDSTVRGVLQNFAATADRVNAVLTSCPLPGEESGEEGISTEDTTHVYEGAGSHPSSGPLPGCVLPLEPDRDADVTPESGLRFGNSPESRLEFRLPTDLANSLMEHSTISLEFRTRHEDGILFYVTNSNKVDFIAIFMKQGRVNVMFNCGTGPGLLTTSEVYNLGEWHSLEFSRRGQMGVLYMDNTTAAQGSSQGTTSSINVKSPIYLGGLPRNVSSQVKNNLRGVTGSFPGCIRKLEVQDRQMLRPRVIIGATGCSQKVETGTFFGANHSHLILYDSYNVGKEMTVELDIKPRRTSGILFAVHSNSQKDFVLLQMVDGNIIFSADNGAGIIKASVTAGNLCDGEWHTVKAAKNKNIVSLAVGAASNLAIGRGGVTATDTMNPLYIGGVPDPSKTRATATHEQYVGCIRYLQINGKLQSMAESTVYGNVQLNSCPTI
ncbi:laminin subunit alpha isoform X2 [Dermacentor andersoni]|uniref:laminin subunit alpha isoform X2 n=1 Tax=Dermacentor andersoni TaxID=34620 RepID=UPI002416E603|nr:laminin subunit alpha-like isoform X2 [Dermacentor andersoni]